MGIGKWIFRCVLYTFYFSGILIKLKNLEYIYNKVLYFNIDLMICIKNFGMFQATVQDLRKLVVM